MSISEETPEHAPWNRQPGEPGLWYSRFHEYLAQSLTRSVLRVFREQLTRTGPIRRGKKPPTTVETIPASWKAAKERYQWVSRAVAWDTYQNEQKAVAWASAREAERAEELRIATALRKKAHALLALSVTVEETKRDRNGAVIAYLLVPQFKAFAVAAQLFSEARTHARGALEMPNRFDRQEVTGRDGAPVEIKHGLTDEERFGRLLALAEQATGGEGGMMTS